MRDNRPIYRSIDDKTRIEMLMLTWDGKLLCKDSEHDQADPERRSRLENYRKRVSDITAKPPVKRDDRFP